MFTARAAIVKMIVFHNSGLNRKVVKKDMNRKQLQVSFAACLKACRVKKKLV